MKIFVLDFETYWDQEYTLSKMTTESYVRDSRFYDHLVGILETDGERILSEGYVPHDHIAHTFHRLAINECAIVAHHTHFEGLILSHHYSKKPKIWFDTLSMSRPIDGATTSGALDALSTKYGLPPKGSVPLETKGRRVLNPLEFRRLGDYCLRDCRNTFWLFKHYWKQLPKAELQMIDVVTRMFTEPELVLNTQVLQEELDEMRVAKANLMLDAGASREVLMSAEKFASRLRALGINPPVKRTAKGNTGYAFAKTDEMMVWLCNEHPDPRVRALCAARLGVKSTIGETRAQSLLDMAHRGRATVYIKYAGALQTLRMAGGDGLNWQNFPRKGRIREAIEAPPDHTLFVGDLKNIENRVLVCLAGQWDAVERFIAYDKGEGVDPYCFLASRVYGKEVTPEMEDERRLGKIATLGLGYQMGVIKFIETARTMGVEVDHKLGQLTVTTFRETYNKVVELWNRAHNIIPAMAQPGLKPFYLDDQQLLLIEHEAIRLPNGTRLRYPNLQMRLVNGEKQWMFFPHRDKAGKTLYGGKVVENVTQALANLVMKEVTVDVSRRYPVKIHSHDELGALAKISEQEEASRYIKGCLTKRREWWPVLPLAASINAGQNYKEAK